MFDEEATVNGLVPAVPFTKSVVVDVVALIPVTEPLSRRILLVRPEALLQRARAPVAPLPERDDAGVPK